MASQNNFSSIHQELGTIGHFFSHQSSGRVQQFGKRSDDRLKPSNSSDDTPQFCTPPHSPLSPPSTSSPATPCEKRRSPPPLYLSPSKRPRLDNPTNPLRPFRPVPPRRSTPLSVFPTPNPPLTEDRLPHVARTTSTPPRRNVSFHYDERRAHSDYTPDHSTHRHQPTHARKRTRSDSTPPQASRARSEEEDRGDNKLPRTERNPSSAGRSPGSADESQLPGHSLRRGWLSGYESKSPGHLSSTRTHRTSDGSPRWLKLNGRDILQEIGTHESQRTTTAVGTWRPANRDPDHWHTTESYRANNDINTSYSSNDDIVQRDPTGTHKTHTANRSTFDEQVLSSRSKRIESLSDLPSVPRFERSSQPAKTQSAPTTPTAPKNTAAGTRLTVGELEEWRRDVLTHGDDDDVYAMHMTQQLLLRELSLDDLQTLDRMMRHADLQWDDTPRAQPLVGMPFPDSDRSRRHAERVAGEPFARVSDLPQGLADAVLGHYRGGRGHGHGHDYTVLKKVRQVVRQGTQLVKTGYEKAYAEKRPMESAFGIDDGDYDDDGNNGDDDSEDARKGSVYKRLVPSVGERHKRDVRNENRKRSDSFHRDSMPFDGG